MLAQPHGAQSTPARARQLQRVGRLPVLEVQPVPLGQGRGELVQAEVAEHLAQNVATLALAKQVQKAKERVAIHDGAVAQRKRRSKRIRQRARNDEDP